MQDKPEQKPSWQLAKGPTPLMTKNMPEANNELNLELSPHGDIYLGNTFTFTYI